MLLFILTANVDIVLFVFTVFFLRKLNLHKTQEDFKIKKMWYKFLSVLLNPVSLVGCSVGSLVGWLFVWLVGRLFVWLVGWLVGQSVRWLVGSSVGCLVGWLVGRSVGRSVVWSVGWLVGRSVGCTKFPR